MDKNFEELFTKVSELQKLQEEREKLKGERLELENRRGALPCQYDGGARTPADCG